MITIENPYSKEKHNLAREFAQKDLTKKEKAERDKIEVEYKIKYAGLEEKEVAFLRESVDQLKDKTSTMESRKEVVESGKRGDKVKLYKDLIEIYREAKLIEKEASRLKKELREK